MIDQKSFAVGMGVLAERFRSELAPAAQSGYYAILSGELETGEFEVAVQLAFRHSQFWPSPQQLIDFANPPVDLTSEAIEMFDSVIDLGEHHATAGRIWRREKVRDLGAPALAGFVAVGANEGLKNLSGQRLAFARRDFIAAYKSKATRIKAEAERDAAMKQIAAPRRLALPPHTSLTGVS